MSSPLIYEVNAQVPKEIYSSYKIWLDAHIEEMLQLPYFSEARVYEAADLSDQQKHLKKIIQNGLYQRWLKNKIEPDPIIKRTDYLRTDDLLSVFQRLSTIDSLNIVTIGPGFDEIESLLRIQLKVCTSPLQDVILRDPHLNWFWKDLKSQIQLHS